MTICKKNLYHVQEFQKKTYNKSIKPRSYITGNKIWLNIKYIKIKQNQKLKAKFFRLFQIFYPVKKQSYKLKLFRNKKIYNVFYILLLKQNTIRKR